MEEDWKTLVALYRDRIVSMEKEISTSKNSHQAEVKRNHKEINDLRAQVSKFEDGEAIVFLKTELRETYDKIDELQTKLDTLDQEYTQARCDWTNEHDDMARREDHARYDTKEAKEALKKKEEEIKQLKRLLNLIS